MQPSVHLRVEPFGAFSFLNKLNDPKEETRWRIVFIFGYRNEPESLPLLLEAFQDESWLIRTEAAVGLCRFDAERVIPEMKKMENDSRSFIRNNARWVIRKIRL